MCEDVSDESDQLEPSKSGDGAAEKFVSNNDKKILAEATQSLENVLEQLSKLSQMRRKVHQVKE